MWKENNGQNTISIERKMDLQLLRGSVGVYKFIYDRYYDDVPWMKVVQYPTTSNKNIDELNTERWDRPLKIKVNFSHFLHNEYDMIIDPTQLIINETEYKHLRAFRFLIFKYFVQSARRNQIPSHGDIFQTICAHGHLHTVQLFVRMVPYDFALKVDGAFRKACQYGHLPVAMWLVKVFPSIKDDINYIRVYNETCQRGHLHVAKWLVRTFTLTPYQDIHKRVFEEACRRGHVHMAKWLARTFSVVDYTEFILHWVYEGGHFQVAKWLARAFPNTDHKDFFSTACRNGHLHMAQWLVRKFPNDDLLDDDSLFMDTCVSGHLHVAKWLVKVFPHIIDQNDFDALFKSVCAEEHLHVAKWLLRMFPNIDLSQYIVERAFRQAWRNNCLRVVKWLVRTFPAMLRNIQPDRELRQLCMQKTKVMKWLRIHIEHEKQKFKYM